MKIITLSVGQVRTNCYLIEDNGEVGIIDPGDDGDYIIRIIQDLGAKPVWIVATHGHFDHLLAVTELALTYEIPFYLHHEDDFLLKRAGKTAKHFLNITADPILLDHLPLTEKTKLSVGKIDFQIMETPGHSPGGICLYNRQEKVMFSGDLIFGRGLVGKTTMEYCSKEDLKKSIKKILKLPEETLVYPGHGEITTLKKTKLELQIII